jgi:predicted esterase
MKKWFFALLFSSAVLLFVFWAQVVAAVKVVLLIAQEFPQIPVKPLNYISREPRVEPVEFGPENDRISGKLILPQGDKKRAAIILAMGVKTDEEGERLLLDISKTLGRLGYIVLWPTSERLNKRERRLEEPRVFVESFKYLQNHALVKKERISYFGISVGASIALAAAQDEQINDEVHAFISFGGYYRLVDYLAAVATKKIIIDEQLIPWEPNKGTVKGIKEAAIDFADENEKEVLRKALLEGEALRAEEKLALSEKANFFLRIFELETPKRLEELLEKLDDESLRKIKRFSPDEKIEHFKARMFILHDKGDSAVPYVESRKLHQALKGKAESTYHESTLFDHVRPEGGFSLETLKELLGLFRFLQQVFMFI